MTKYLNIRSGYKTANVTKQRLLQNSDYYKTATVAKRRTLQNEDCGKKIFLYIKQKHYVNYFFNLLIHILELECFSTYFQKNHFQFILSKKI